MGRVSTAAIAIVGLGVALAALAQDNVPDVLLGIKDGAYGSFTPDDVRAGESGATPTPPADGSFLLEAKDGALTWAAFGDAFSGELYTELIGGGVPSAGSLLDVLAIDTEARTATIGAVALGADHRLLRVKTGAKLTEWVDPAVAVASGLPSYTGNGGRVLGLNTAATALEWTAKGSGGTPLPTLIADAVLRVNSDATAVEWNTAVKTLIDGLPALTGQKGKALTVNTAEDGLQWSEASGGAQLSDDKPEALGPAVSGAGTTASRHDHVHPTTGVALATDLASTNATVTANTKAITRNTETIGHVRQVSDPGAQGVATGNVLTRTGAASYGWRAIPAVRAVPDPAHIADGDVLTVKSGAYAWATPATGGGGELDWDLLFSVVGTATTAKVLTLPAANCDQLRNLALGTTVQFSRGSTYRSAGIVNWGQAGGIFVAASYTDSDGPISYELVMGNKGETCTIETQIDTWTASSVRRNVRFWTLSVAGGGGGGGSATPLSNGLPVALGTASAGVATAASRGDHVHPDNLPARSSSNALWNLRVNSAGDGVEWSNTLDRELTALDTRVTRIDTPSGQSAPKVGQSYQVVSCTGTGENTACQSGFRDQADPPGFGQGWVKLFEGQENNVGGTAQLSLDLSASATEAKGFLAAMRDVDGAGVYRQFLFQIAWNIGEGAAEALAQTQAVLPGVPLGGSVAGATQPVQYQGTLPTLDSVCVLTLQGTVSETTITTTGCTPDWGNRGSAGNVNLFWKLWGQR